MLLLSFCNKYCRNTVKVRTKIFRWQGRIKALAWKQCVIWASSSMARFILPVSTISSVPTAKEIIKVKIIENVVISYHIKLLFTSSRYCETVYVQSSLLMCKFFKQLAMNLVGRKLSKNYRKKVLPTWNFGKWISRIKAPSKQREISSRKHMVD